eukprot:scaffold153929_cov31-Tisochrysis_lutea.AAC.4
MPQSFAGCMRHVAAALAFVPPPPKGRSLWGGSGTWRKDNCPWAWTHALALAIGSGKLSRMLTYCTRTSRGTGVSHCDGLVAGAPSRRMPTS